MISDTKMIVWWIIKMLNFSQKYKEAFEKQSHKNTEQNIFTQMYPLSCCISIGKEYYPSPSIRKGVGVEKEQARDLSNENTLSESLLWWGVENILLLFKDFRKAFVCSGSIYLLVGSRERWEVVGKEKLMDFQSLFLPPTLVQLTISRTFFITYSSYLFCQCQLINLSHFLSWLPGKMENSKSLHRHCQTDWIGGKMVMVFLSELNLGF